MKDVNIYIYTEYSGSFSKGSGKYHVILECMVKTKKGLEPATVKEMGFEADTTKNRLELLAIDKALKHITERSRISIHTTSEYVTDAFLQGWIDKWTRNDFKSGKKEIKHADLWKSVIGMIEKNDVAVFKSPKTPYTAVQMTELKNLEVDNEEK